MERCSGEAIWMSVTTNRGFSPFKIRTITVQHLIKVGEENAVDFGIGDSNLRTPSLTHFGTIHFVSLSNVTWWALVNGGSGIFH